MRRLHVIGNFLQHAFLRAGGLERQHGFDLFAHAIVQFERNARLQSRFGALQGQAAFQPEELFEDQPPVRRSAIGIQHAEVAVRGRKVQGADGGPQVEQLEAIAK